jgi:lysophospholipase L1-like esterase
MLSLLCFLVMQPPDAERFAKWEAEIVRIEKRLKANPPRPGGVIFIGSSTIRLWDLKKSFPGVDYANAGFGGSEIRDCTHFVPRLVAPFQPKTIVFFAGDNDIASNRKPEQVLTDFKTFAAVVHKDVPKCRVLFISVKPSIARWAKFDVQQKANKLVKAFCETDDRLGYVDIVAAMLDSNGKPNPELFQKDGLHMNALGYEKWVPIVKAALEKSR